LLKLADFLADKIEVNKDIISILTKKNDMAKHATVAKYKLNANKIVKIEKYLTCLKSKSLINDEILIPYAFLEAIQVKNFILAREYLTESTSKALTDLHLENYFGKIYDIKQSHLDEQNILAVVYKNEHSYFAKYFKFTLINNKIDNIDEI